MSDKMNAAKIVVYCLLVIYITIYGNRYILLFLLYFSVTKSFQKVKRKMDFGHFFGHL